jgi:HK97 family phage portal protein
MFLSHGALVTKTPVDLRGTSYFHGMPPMSSPSWPSAYAGIYSRQLWVYVVVSKLAKAAARLPLPVYERNELDRPRRDDHPLAQLLRNPNPGLSGFDLMLWTSSTFDIYGDTFWYKLRRGGQAVGLYPLHPSSMTWESEKGTWRFDNGNRVLDNIKDADLVHFRGFHPDSTVRGLSPLEPLRSTLENEWHARTATSSFWQRGARPGMALKHPGNLSDAAQDRLKAQIDNVSAGSDKTGVTVVLEEGMEPAVMTLTAEEAQYIETRKLNREEVCAAYDVPPPVVHILDRATFSNITEQMRSMYRDTMAPRLKAFEAAIELDLRQAEWPNDDIYAEFLMDEVLRGDFETRQDALNKASHMTIAEKRKVENLPFIEGTDRIFLNTATMPLDAIDAQAAAIAAQTQDADEPLAEVIPLSVARSVMGRLSWQRSLDQVDPAALTDGLSEVDAKYVRDALGAEKGAEGSVKGLRDRLRGMAKKDADPIRVKAPDLAPHQERVRTVLEEFFARQAVSVIGSGNFDKDQWDADLAADLHATAVAVSSSIGKATMRTLGFDPSVYDVARTVDFLQAVSERLAGNINETTRGQLADADDPAEVFRQATESRAEGIAVGATTLVAGFAVVESARRVAEADGREPQKTWVTGPNPRPEHAALDGQTVGIDETFSNGANWPGDDGEPGCNCSVEVGL